MRHFWRIDMLGVLRATSEDAAISRFRTRRVGLLLAFLAYHRDRSFSREELADMLWPEFGVEQAKINLRQTLASLRRHIEPPSLPKGAVLVAEHDRISINSSLVDTDTSEFIAAIERTKVEGPDRLDRLKEAADLYKGDLLPGYYEEWVFTERRRLEDLFLATLEQLIEESDLCDRLDEAIPQIHAALAKDKLREDLHFALMRAYQASGSPARALRQFEDWKALAGEELGIEPSPEMSAFADTLISEPQTAPAKGRKPHAAVKTKRPAADLPERETVARLPIVLTRFFGRGQEHQEWIDQIASHEARLVTLLGPAGAGKTRLSIEIGKTLADEHGWNVWFVPLADISHGSMLLDSLLGAMRLRREAQSTPLEQLRSVIAGSKNLIIFDNLEHIVESASSVIGSVLAEVPGVACMTTSRQRLSLQGERVVDLASLAPPDPIKAEEDPTRPCSREELLQFAAMPAVQLFVDRSQSVRPDFQLTTRNAYAVAAICAALDSLPLALEIAAGLSNAFTPAQMLANLDNRLALLQSRLRDVNPRHRSLWAAISYSYEMLSPGLQRFFTQLSVFRGGFTVEAAEGVCLTSDASGKTKKRFRECLRAILDLQERSLLRAEEVDEKSDPRFRLLESFREFGQEQLSSDEQEQLELKHADFFYEKSREYFVPRKRVPALNPDRENWLVAMATHRKHGDLHKCVGLLVGLRSSSRFERESIKELFELPQISDLAPEDLIWLLCLHSRYLREELHLEEGRKVSERALELAKALGNDDLISLSYSELSDTISYLGQLPDALKYAEKVLEHGLKAENMLAIEVGYVNIGMMRWAMGDLQAAIESLKGGLDTAIRRTHGDPDWVVVNNLARVHLDADLLDDALEFASTGLRIAKKHQDEHGASLCLAMVARYHFLKGNLTAAIATSHESLIRRRNSSLYWRYNAIQNHARIMLAMGNHQEGTALLAASRLVAKFGREPDDRDFIESHTLAKASLPDQEFERAWATGLAMSLEEAFLRAAEFR